MLDYIGIFKSFNEKKIKYVVIGGLAVNFYGVPRMTYDIDVLLDLEDKNIAKFLSLLKSWGFKPKIPVNITDFAVKDKREDWISNRNMKAFNLVNPDWAVSEIDIIIDSPVDYRKAAKDMKNINVNGVLIPTVSMRNLILMKKSAGRIQDKEDIKSLKKVSR
jgi:hypothetical protein